MQQNSNSFFEIRDNVFAYISATNSSNCYLLKSDKLIIIDSGLECDFKILELALSKIGVSSDQIDFVFHTHGHADHFGGSNFFPNAKLWMSKHDAEKLNSKDSNFTANYLLGSKLIPNITNFFDKNQKFKFKNFELKVIETSGHTKGSVCFYEPSLKILFSGDTIFKGAFGRYDLPTGNLLELKESISKLAKIDYSMLLPGHGAILTEKTHENIAF